MTDAGEALLLVLRESFDRIEEAIREMQTGNPADPLRISLTSYFAARWLTRRLGDFSALHPQIEMHLHLINADIDFRRMDLDLAIAWGHGEWPELEAELLMPIQVTVVCSPDILANGPPLETIDDLQHHRLLHETGRELWETWLSAIGAAIKNPM